MKTERSKDQLFLRDPDLKFKAMYALLYLPKLYHEISKFKRAQYDVQYSYILNVS